MNDLLWRPARIGALTICNRLVRSATAERMVDDNGIPRPEYLELYRELARGGAGLIISGHFLVHPSGKADSEMACMDKDTCVPALKAVTDAVHAENGVIVAQINHGGMQCSPLVVSQTIAPSAIGAPLLEHPARAMSLEEIEMIIDAFAQAARRAQEAGYDGVQIHSAHGYLINQFLSPYVNRRTDEWGGSLENRLRFLRRVTAAVRQQVGPGYPILIKLAMLDGIEGGLEVSEGAQIASALSAMGFDAIEISGGISGPKLSNSRTGIRTPQDEAYFRPLAQMVRPLTNLPILLVGGFRSASVMEDVLQSGDANFISLCRPFICEPLLPLRLIRGQKRSACISCNLCYPQEKGLGIACRSKTNPATRN